MSTFVEIFGPQGFDCNSVDPTDDFLKPGDYTVQIIESEVRPNRAQSGHYLALVMQIVQEDKNKDRKIYDYINIQNPNAIAEQMAARSLSALGRSTNIWKIEDPRQLLGQVVIAVVTKNDSGNNVRTYKPAGQMQSAVAAPAVALPLPGPHAPNPAVVVPQTVMPPASAAPTYAPVIVQQEVPLVTPPAPAVSPAPMQTAVPEAVAGVPVWLQKPQQ